MGDSAYATATQIGFTLAGYAIAGPFGGLIGSALGAYVAQQLFGTDIEISRGRISDLKVSTSQYGNPAPVVWGCFRLGGTPYFNSDLIEKVDKQEEGGGKGGPTTTTKTYYYSINIGYKFAENHASFPVVAIPKLWANGKLIADFTNETGPVFVAKYAGEGGGPFNSGTIRLRFGAEDQDVDPIYEEIAGVDVTPSDRGYATVVLEDFPLEDFGNAAPQLTALVCTAVSDVYPSIDMTWTGGQNTGFLRFIPGTRIIYAESQRVDPPLVNSDEREFVRSGTTLEPLLGTGGAVGSDGDAPEGIYDVDRFGRMLTVDILLSTAVVPFLHDAETYQVIARGAYSDSVGAHTGRFFGPNDERIILIGNTGYKVWSSGTFIAATTETYTFNGNLMPVVKGFTTWASDPGLANTDATQVDGQTGHLWSIHASGSDSVLVHWDLNMEEIERFTVTGFQPDSQDVWDLGYDAVSHSFFFIDSQTLVRWEIETQVTTTLVLPSTTNENGAAFSSIHNGIVYLQAGIFGGGVQAIDVANMEVHAQYNMTLSTTWDDAAPRGPLYDPVLHAIIASPTTNTPVTWFFLDRVDTDGVTLESILNNEVLRSGYEGGSNDRDATDHTSTNVLGWVAGNQTAVVGESQQQADLYKFGHVESDHKIKFPARYRATSFALTDDDLGVVQEGGSPSRKLQIERIDQSDLPVASEIQFSDPNLDYQEGLQRARLVPETVPGTDKTISRSFRVVLTNAEAKQREERNLITAYYDQQIYKFSTFHSKLAIDPGDTGTITSDGTTHLVMVDEVSLGANFIYEVQAVGFAIPTAAEADSILAELQALNDELASQGSDGFVAQTIDQPNQAQLVMIDAPFMIDEVDPGNDRLLNQMVVQRRSEGISWNGAVIQRAPDGENYSDWHFYEAALEGEIGLVSSALGEARDWTVVDTDNTVDVSFREGLALASVSDADFVAGKNNFLIGKEFIRARDVSDLGNGEWRLSHLYRALRGTEWAVAERIGSETGTFDHTAWEYAIYLGDVADADKASAKSIPFADLNVQYYYRAQALGALPSTGLEKIFTNTGRSHMPYAPADIAGVKSSGDWNITWTRRDRVGGVLHDYTEILETDPQVYEIDILSEDGATVVRTLNATTESVTYTESQMQTDFENPVVNSYPLYRLRIVVYQVNDATVGRGFPGAAVLEDFPDPLPDDSNFDDVVFLSLIDSLPPVDISKNTFDLTARSGSPFFVSGDWIGPLTGAGGFSEPISQYGVGVIDFVGGGGYAVEDADKGSEFAFGSNDFTVEAWIHRRSNHNGLLAQIWLNSSGEKEWKFWTGFNAGGLASQTLFFRWSTDGDATSTIEGAFGDEDIGIAHVAFSRVGNTGSLYYKGTRIATGDMTGVTIFSGSSQDMSIAQDPGDAFNFDGWYDSIRITNGTGRYSGTTITVPPHEFADTGGGVLLSTGNFSIPPITASASGAGAPPAGTADLEIQPTEIQASGALIEGDLLLSGDEQSNGDGELLSGDAQSNGDVIEVSGS